MNSEKESDSKNNDYNSDKPETAFKTIRVFRSLEEENEYTYRSYARISPEERLAAVTRMRLTAHPYLDDNPRPWGKKIYFSSK